VKLFLSSGESRSNNHGDKKLAQYPWLNYAPIVALEGYTKAK
jgi:hypothetical protein